MAARLQVERELVRALVGLLDLSIETHTRLRAGFEIGYDLRVLALQGGKLRVALAERVQRLRDGGIA